MYRVRAGETEMGDRLRKKRNQQRKGREREERSIEKRERQRERALGVTVCSRESRQRVVIELTIYYWGILGLSQGELGGTR